MPLALLPAFLLLTFSPSPKLTSLLLLTGPHAHPLLRNLRPSFPRRCHRRNNYHSNHLPSRANPGPTRLRVPPFRQRPGVVTTDGQADLLGYATTTTVGINISSVRRSSGNSSFDSDANSDDSETLPHSLLPRRLPHPLRHSPLRRNLLPHLGIFKNGSLPLSLPLALPFNPYDPRLGRGRYRRRDWTDDGVSVGYCEEEDAGWTGAEGGRRGEGWVLGDCEGGL